MGVHNRFHLNLPLSVVDLYLPGYFHYGYAVIGFITLVAVFELVRRMMIPTQADHTIIPGAKIMIMGSPIAGTIVRMPARLKAMPT